METARRNQYWAREKLGFRMAFHEVGFFVDSELVSVRLSDKARGAPGQFAVGGLNLKP